MNPLTQYTEEELERLLTEKREASRLLKEKQRNDYETLKNETVTELCQEAMECSEALKTFKTKSFESMQAFYVLMQEYGKHRTGGKGTFKIEHNGFRIEYARQETGTFDERSLLAEQHIIDFINSSFDGNEKTRKLIMLALERKKGNLDTKQVQKLHSMEDDFDNESWREGLRLFKESFFRTHTKDYIRFYMRNENNKWEQINLQYSNA